MNVSNWPVQLAHPGECSSSNVATLTDRGYYFDVKWDGVRAVAAVDMGRAELYSRKGDPFGYRYPEIITALETKFAGRTVTLDGEVIIFDPADGKPKFGLTGQRALGPSRTRDIARLADMMPATYVAFDCLRTEMMGDIREQSQTFRIGSLTNCGLGGSRLIQSLTTFDGPSMLNAVETMGLEGMIAKDPEARYKGGRNGSWLKLKPTSTCTALVTGWEPGEGWRSETFGALSLAVLSDSGDMVPIGKVGSGFSVADLTLLDPFVKSGVEVMVEVEYQERQPGTGVLRFPVFLGARWDLDRSAASITQFA